LGQQPTQDRVEIADLLYNAGADTLLNAVRELPDDCRVALLIGHAPGVPGLVHEMTDPANSTPEAVAAIESRFPAAALAQLQFEGDWSQIDTGSLVSMRMPRSASR
jgi:phosphohistidine phosphatase